MHTETIEQYQRELDTLQDMPCPIAQRFLQIAINAMAAKDQRHIQVERIGVDEEESE